MLILANSSGCIKEVPPTSLVSPLQPEPLIDPTCKRFAEIISICFKENNIVLIFPDLKSIICSYSTAVSIYCNPSNE